MLGRHPDALGSLLDHLSVVDDQDRVGTPELGGDIVTDLGFQFGGTPRTPAQKRLDTSGMGVPRALSEGPAVLLLQIRGHALDQGVEDLAGLGSGEHVRHTVGQLAQLRAVLGQELIHYLKYHAWSTRDQPSSFLDPQL